MQMTETHYYAIFSNFVYSLPKTFIKNIYKYFYI